MPAPRKKIPRVSKAGPTDDAAIADVARIRTEYFLDRKRYQLEHKTHEGYVEVFNLMFGVHAQRRRAAWEAVRLEVKRAVSPDRFAVLEAEYGANGQGRDFFDWDPA